MFDEIKMLNEDTRFLPPNPKSSDSKSSDSKPSDLKLPVQKIRYQYRTFDGFWAIVKSDSLWLTNARFSNDDEEERLGIDLVKKIIGRSRRDKNEDNDQLRLSSESFISCFCQEGDRLSQWRGYSPNGGVSIGFDLSHTGLLLSVLRSDMNSVDDVDSPEQRVLCYSALRVVNYTKLNAPENSTLSQIVQNWSISPQKTAIGDDSVALKQIRKYLPYIKHEGFAEEMESRLVIANNDNRVDSCIRYRKSESSAVQVPYIVVHCGDPLWKGKECIVRTSFDESHTAEGLQKKLIEMMEKEELCYVPKVIDCCKRKNDDVFDEYSKYCFGCSKRERFSIDDNTKSCRGLQTFGFEKGEQDIYISQGKDQEKVCAAVRQCLKGIEGKWKVWCEGHLPIRKIMIGPCPNKFEVRESIEYYCKHTYWLHDVDIEVSEIPYRQRL